MGRGSVGAASGQEQLHPEMGLSQRLEFCPQPPIAQQRDGEAADLRREQAWDEGLRQAGKAGQELGK